MTLTYVSLFAGVGGADLGFDATGQMRCVGQVELDDKCRQVLANHWKDVPRHDDVRTAIPWATDNGLVGNVDIVVGGFPCQDLSVAGKRAGLEGNRSGLFWDAVAFASHVQANWIVLENVVGLFSSNSGADFAAVLDGLGRAGYLHREWATLDAQQHGVPQRRKRVFIVASRLGTPSGRPIFTEREGSVGDLGEVIAQGQETARDAAESTGSDVWAGSASGEGIAAPLLSNTKGGLRTTDLDGASFVIEQRVGNFELYDFPDANVAPTITARRARDAVVYPHHCEETCVNCGNDVGPHHLCSDCLEGIG